VRTNENYIAPYFSLTKGTEYIKNKIKWVQGSLSDEN
jgi:hypothetical protein